MRNQKDKNRQRHLYTLLFKNGRAYIGQTVDLHHQGEHSRTWFERFDMSHLGDCDGSYAEAKAHEYAYGRVRTCPDRRENRGGAMAVSAVISRWEQTS